MKKHEVALNKSGIKFAGITTTLCRRCVCPEVCYSCTIPSIYELDQIHWDDRCISLRVQQSNMSFLDIKDPAKRTALVDEYVKAMKTVRRRNMANREMKQAIGEELQTVFHPIVSATKQAAEKTVEELAHVKKALEDIDGTLKAQ